MIAALCAAVSIASLSLVILDVMRLGLSTTGSPWALRSLGFALAFFALPLAPMALGAVAVLFASRRGSGPWLVVLALLLCFLSLLVTLLYLSVFYGLGGLS